MSFFRKAFGLPPRGEPEADNVRPVARSEAGQTGIGPDQDRIILCIPGPWEDRQAFQSAVITASSTPEYLPAGLIMLHQPSQTGFAVSFDDHDVDMANAFAAAGRPNEVDNDFIKQVSTHKSVCYLLSMDEEQSPQAAEAIAKAALAVVKAGGIGVKVETAGKAFTAAQWRELVDSDFIDLYWLMVLDSITDRDTTYSCGMRNLGLPDAIVSGEEFQAAIQLLRSFNRYQLYESPELEEGHTFGMEEGAPRFRLSHEDDQPYDDLEIYTNNFGMWRLSRADTAH